MMNENFFALGLIFLFGLIFFAYAVRPSSKIHRVTVSEIKFREKIVLTSVIAILIAILTIPMSWNPCWNGEKHLYHNLYQELTDAFLNGQLYLKIPVEPRILAMENPYDYQARENLGLLEDIDYQWDHSLYNGRYYVYFGVFPVLTTFLPYKLLFGEHLPPYVATQIFSATFTVGMFAFLLILAKKFFPRMKFSVFLTSATALTLICISHCTEAPALYCTASAAGLSCEIWSLYLFFAAINDNSAKKLFFGALLGALAFSCKPTIALANLLLIPLLPMIFAQKNAPKTFLTLFLPYFVVGLALMTYNFLRFDDPFQFGQIYQLTIADHHNFGNFSERFSISKQIDGFLVNFFGIRSEIIITDDKPPGVFAHYVILWLPIIFVRKKFFNALSERKLVFFAIFLLITPILITATQIHWAVFLIERYRLEIYWLLAILAFIALGCASETLKSRKFNFAACILALITIFQCANLFFVPNDENFAEIYPELRPTLEKILTLGLQ